MKKLKIYLLGFLLSTQLVAFEDFLVSDIRIIGLQRVSTGSIFNVIPISVGDNIDQRKSSDITRSLFATEQFDDIQIGKEGNKEVASKIEEVIVNVVKQTKIQGYEMWEKAVYETPNGQYRVYVGLKMGVGDANKLAEYIAKHANHDVDVDALAKAAVESVIIEKVD